jgi:putative membrane protein
MERIARSIRVALTSTAVPAAAWAQDRPWDGWGMHPMWGMWGIWGMWGLVMTVVMLAFWGLVIAGLVVGLRWLMREGSGSRPDAALDVLRQRYARGEISKEEFEAKKRDLS